MSASVPCFDRSSLYVGNLHPKVNEAGLYEKFSTIGPVLYIRVCRDLVSHHSLGYAYVKYLVPEDSQRALDTLNFVMINGKPMRLLRTRRDPSLRHSGVGKIFIKNLCKSIDSKSLYDTFSVFGKILSCKVVTDESGSRGLGFLHFEKSQAARRAIDKVNGTLLKGKRVFMGPFTPRQKREAERRAQANMFTDIYIKNFGDDVDNKCLREVFGQFGTILRVRVVTDERGLSKGFGFVSFDSFKDAQKAIKEMNGKFLNGNQVSVGIAQNKVERQFQPKHKFEPMKEDKLTWRKGATLYVRNLEDDVDENRLRREFSLFGTITGARVVMEAGHSKGFGFVCYTSPEEARRAIKEMNGKILVTEPLYVAIARSKMEHQALLNKDYIETMSVRHGDNPIRNSHKEPTTSSNFLPVLPPPQHGSANICSPVVKARHLLPQSIHYANHSTTTAPKPSFSTFRSPQVLKVKSDNQNTNTSTKTMPCCPQTSAAGPHASQRFKKFSVVPCVDSPLHFKVERPATIQKPVSASTQGHLSNIYVLASATTQKKILGEKLFPLVQCIHPALTGEISGILLKMDDAEILHMLKYPESLRAKIDEAILDLRSHQA